MAAGGAGGRPGRLAIPLAAAVFLAAALLLPWVGAGPIDVGRVLGRETPDFEIMVELRLSRTLLGLLAGGALSLAGTLFQAMLRESLATPDTLGVSAGAALGAVVTIALGWTAFWGVPATWLGALVGALLVLFSVVGAGRRGGLSAWTLLLTGIAVNSVCAAGILILSSFAGVARSFSITRWLIGGVEATDFRSLGLLGLLVVLASALLLRDARGWNLLAVGERWAATRGVEPERLMHRGYLLGSLLVAGTVALTGPIGFVGLIVPHLLRSRVSGDHRVLMPCAFFYGGALLAGSDALGRALLAPAEIPAGAILALIGGPYLVSLVRRRRPFANAGR